MGEVGLYGGRKRSSLAEMGTSPCLRAHLRAALLPQPDDVHAPGTDDAPHLARVVGSTSHH